MRDSGKISIGTYMAILKPREITEYLRNDIPLLQTNLPAQLLITPELIIPVPINTKVGTNHTCGFSIEGVRLRLDLLYFQESMCSGSFCDGQRALELHTSNRSCGCYTGSNRCGSVAIVYDIEVDTSNNNFGLDNFKHVGFSSHQFSKLFLNNPLPVTVRKSTLIETDNSNALEDAIDLCFEYINSNGVFTIHGWSKRGEINDHSFEEQQEKIESSEMRYHVVHITPTNKECVKDDPYKAVQFDTLQLLIE